MGFQALKNNHLYPQPFQPTLRVSGKEDEVHTELSRSTQGERAACKRLDRVYLESYYN
jgi:hypothetical protein